MVERTCILHNWQNFRIMGRRATRARMSSPPCRYVSEPLMSHHSTPALALAAALALTGPVGPRCLGAVGCF